MCLENILNEVNEFNEYKKSFISKIVNTLKDTNHTLNERWKVYLKVENLLPTSIYGDGFIEKLDTNLTLYDDFYMERHQTCNFSDILEKIEEDGKEIPLEKLENWKETVLQSGHGSFIYDW